MRSAAPTQMKVNRILDHRNKQDLLKIKLPYRCTECNNRFNIKLPVCPKCLSLQSLIFESVYNGITRN